jgi:hypothetical protein
MHLFCFKKGYMELCPFRPKVVHSHLKWHVIAHLFIFSTDTGNNENIQKNVITTSYINLPNYFVLRMCAS